MLCYIMLCYVMLRYVMSCYVMLCYVMLCNITEHYYVLDDVSYPKDCYLVKLIC